MTQMPVPSDAVYQKAVQVGQEGNAIVSELIEVIASW